MDESQEIIKEQLEKLPKSIRDAIASVDLGSKIKKIADKNMLHIDQAGNLENETLFVMLGLEPTVDYKENIRKELNISRDRAQSITADIDKEVFMQIRESLKKVQNSPSDTIDKPQEKKEINHVNLETQPTKKESTIDMVKESEDIKQRVTKQQIAKSVVPPPSNLPTSEPVAGQQQDQSLKIQPSDGEEKDKQQNNNENNSSPVLKKNKPYSTDPYREPIEE